MAGGCVPVMCVGWFSSFFAGLFFLKNHRAEIPHSDGVGEVFFFPPKKCSAVAVKQTPTLYIHAKQKHPKVDLGVRVAIYSHVPHGAGFSHSVANMQCGSVRYSAE